MNQPWLHIYSICPETPFTSLPTQSLWVVPEHQLCLPCFTYWTGVGYLFYIWQYTWFNATLSTHPALAFSYRVQKYVLCICVSLAAPYVGSSLLQWGALMPQLHLWMDQPNRKVTRTENNTVDQLDLIDIYRAFHTKTMDFTFFSSARGSFWRLEHILGHNSSLSKLKKKKLKSFQASFLITMQ